MSNMLRTPSAGPIVGHTTASSVRLWMRGSDETAGRTIGIAFLYDSNKKYIAKSATYFRLHRDYDRTGTVDFSMLSSNTKYFARLASLTLDSTDSMTAISDDDIEKKLPPAEAWKDEILKLNEIESLASFTTFPEKAGGDLSFIFGSCRYPGLIASAKKADQIFGSILQQFQGKDAPQFLLMVGDQIYADKLNAFVLGKADTPSEFHERYITAFTSPNMRSLLRQTPCYMILDDHEIEDNWVSMRALFQTAISAYMSYQWVHSPRNYEKNREISSNDGTQLFYSFNCSGYPFFVMDSRTQRIRDDDDDTLDNNHLLGLPSKSKQYPGQIDALCDWLVKQQQVFGDRPKFLVSPSVFTPNDADTAGDSDRALRKKQGSDSWPAFPETRRQILHTLVDNSVNNVVFISGDVHCSSTAEMSFIHQKDGPLPIRAFSITSSAFYWPWPFADGDPNTFVHDSNKENDNFRISNEDEVNDVIEMRYVAKNFEQEDNFTRVDISGNTISIRNFDRYGKPLSTKSKIAIG